MVGMGGFGYGFKEAKFRIKAFADWLDGVMLKVPIVGDILFLAVVVLGFCTWEGGLFGIQKPHQEFKRFESDLDAGKHVFFVDVDSDQEAALSRIVEAHPRMQQAGEGRATPKVVVSAENKFHDAMQTLP